MFFYKDLRFLLLILSLSFCPLTIGTLGVNNPHRAPFGWESQPSNQKPLFSDDVKEGACLSPPPANDPTLNITWAFEPRTWYQPVANRYGYALYAEILLGRSAKSIYELERMCPIVVAFAPGEFILSGYGSVHFQSCAMDSIDPNSIYCHQNGGSFNVNVHSLETELDRIILTDNLTYVLIVRCINNKYKDYLLLTTTPTVPIGLREKMCPKLKSLGFKLQWAVRLACSLNSYGISNKSSDKNYPNYGTYSFCEG